MEQPVRHLYDADRVFVGHEGHWTMCGQQWEPQPSNGERCPECVAELTAFADGLRQGNR